jgi:hypothetical protein
VPSKAHQYGADLARRQIERKARAIECQRRGWMLDRIGAAGGGRRPAAP